MFSRTGAGAVLGALALMSAVAAPAQAATAQDQSTVVISHTSTDKEYGSVLTFTSAKPMTAATAAQVKSMLTQRLNAPDSSEGATAGGPSGAQLYCNNAYSFSDFDGTFSFQHKCGATSSPWGYQLHKAICAVIPGGLAGDVTEYGLAWYRNGQRQRITTAHVGGFCGRVFHGTFNPDHDGDRISYIDNFSFAIEAGNVSGKGTVTISGSFTSLGSAPPCVRRPGKPC